MNSWRPSQTMNASTRSSTARCAGRRTRNFALNRTRRFYTNPVWRGLCSRVLWWLDEFDSEFQSSYAKRMNSTGRANSPRIKRQKRRFISPLLNENIPLKITKTASDFSRKKYFAKSNAFSRHSGGDCRIDTRLCWRGVTRGLLSVLPLLYNWIRVSSIKYVIIARLEKKVDIS